MLIVSRKISKKELDDSVPEMVRQINEFFVGNPKRRVCRTQLWYGAVVSVRKNHVEEDVKAQADKTETYG